MLKVEQARFIRALEDENGHISPHVVLEAARPVDSVIHDLFTWDVAAAAQKHWIDRAQELIRFVRVEVVWRKETIRVPAYVPDPERPPRTKRYLALTIAAREREVAQRVLLDELDRIAQAIRRAEAVAKGLGLFRELETLLADVSSLKTRAERLAEAKKRKGKGKKRGRPRKDRDDRDDDRPRP